MGNPQAATRQAPPSLLAALLLVVFPAAAVDALLVRSAYSYWPTTPSLFGGMLLLWTCLALLALPFVWVLRRWLRRFGYTGWSVPLFVCLVLPVACHDRLDRFTHTGSGFADLRHVLPWLATLATAVVVLLLALGLLKLSLRTNFESTRLGLVLALVASLAGSYLPLHSSFRGAELGRPRPNLLLVVIDTVRARSLLDFGGRRATSPNLTRLAAESMLFENMRSASTFTFTSHLSMLTGVYPSEHGAWLLDMRYDPSRAAHVAELLNRAGYRTAAFVGTNVLSGKTGIDWGFETYDDRVDPSLTYGKAWALIHDLQVLSTRLVPALDFNGRPHWIQDFQRPADGVLAAARAWIGEPDPRPYFCMLNLYDAHWPYLPDEASRAALVGEYAGPVDGFAERQTALPPDYVMTPADDAHMTELYEAEILELDTKLGAFFETIGLEDTALIVTADHGEAFGEGGRYEHNDLLEPQVFVPLLVRGPGGRAAGQLQAGGRSQAPTSGIDVAPTLLGLAGLDKPERMRGLDLTRETPDPERLRLVEDRDHLSSKYYHFAIYRDGFKFVRASSAAEGAGLFDLASDVDAVIDVSATYPELAAELEALLDDERASWGANDEPLKARGEAAEGLGALGYLGD